MSRRFVRFVWFWLALCGSLGAASNASAFCRATTCDPSNPSLDCAPDTHSCLTVGTPLAWPSSCVNVSVQADGAPTQNIDYAAAAASVTRAFEAWTTALCTSSSTPAITVNVQGPITCGASEYNSTGQNANIVVFREDSWPYPGGEDGVLGLTMVRFDPNSGDIWDSDIEVNAAGQPLSIGDAVPGHTDLDSLLTHEAGHLLGLAHSSDSRATMFPGYQAGTIDLRTLSPDDIAAICNVYPPGRQVRSTSCEPRRGYSDRCGVDQPPLAMSEPDSSSTAGCVISVRAQHAPKSLGVFGMLGVLVAFRRIARARRATRGRAELVTFPRRGLSVFLRARQG